MTQKVRRIVVGNLISDTAVYDVKKVFNPKSLPATKGDIETMLVQIQELQQLLAEMKFKSKFWDKIKSFLILE